MTNADEPDAIFVYGTLKTGQGNHHLLAPFVLSVTEARVVGKLYDLGPFPALIAGSNNVHGELVRIHSHRHDDALAVVDELEDYDPHNHASSMYLREIVEAVTPSGERSRAFVYTYNERCMGHLSSVGVEVTDGRWSGPSGSIGSGTGKLAAFADHVFEFGAGSGSIDCAEHTDGCERHG